MKYIRTKNEIFERMFPDCETQRISFDHKTIEPAYYTINHDWVAQKDVIKQADTIEELCDEFVYIDEFFKREHRLAYSLENALALCKYHDVDITTLRGAIWTDKGLIYVAKMNEKGELELL